jgi:hypothetical protein
MAIEETIQPLTNDQRTQWNGFLSNLNGQPVTEDAINAHAEANPDFSIKPEMLPQIQQEHAAIRTGDNFGALNADQLNAARTGMSPNFINQTDLSKSFYPQFKVGSKDFGTDIEGYNDFKTGGGTAPTDKPVPVPQKWDDSKQVQNYRNALYHKYGKGSEDIVDMPEYVNLQPQDASDTLKNLTVKAASKLGIKPEVLFSSSMVEGMKGLATSAAQKTGAGEDWSGDKDYPISGFVNFGLDNFSDKYPELVKKGYLSKDFAKNFNKSVETNEKKKKVNSANFKTVDAAIEAKAAMIKDIQDTTDQFAKKHGIKLSDRGRDFFTLIGYNGGEGSMQEMMQSYNKEGYLKDDKYIDTRPSDSWKSIHREVSKRLKGADVLKGETYF